MKVTKKKEKKNIANYNLIQLNLQIYDVINNFGLSGTFHQRISTFQTLIILCIVQNSEKTK